MDPVQLGPAKDGCLSLAYAVRACLERNPGWVAFKVDFRNAFNECDRAAFLAFIAKSLPCLLPCLHAAYADPVFLSALCDDGVLRLLSRWGSTQGCNFGPLCFQAAIQPGLKQVAADYPDCFVGGIHDDLCVAGTPDRASAALHALLAAARLVGLTASGHKFGLLVPRDLVGGDVARALERAVLEYTPPEQVARGRCCRAQSDGLVLAGVPVGTADFQSSHVHGVLDTHQAQAPWTVRATPLG